MGTFLGGPLVAGYLMAENFKVFNEPDRAKKAWIYAIIVTIVVFGGIFLVQDVEKIPREIIPLLYSGAAYLLVQYYQEKKIIAYIKEGGKTYNIWRSVSIGIIGAVITVIPVFGIAYLTDVATDSTVTKTYGTVKNEISFDKSNISVAEIDKIAVCFTKISFFDEETPRYGSTYEISISCNKSVENKPSVIAIFVQLRSDMQKMFPNNKIIFKLVVDSLDNVVKRIE